jgi:hypothetical protein
MLSRMRFIPKYKVDNVPVFSSAGEETRFDELLKKVHVYNKEFNAERALDAIFWAKRTTAERSRALPRDIFSNPLIIAERLAELGQADEKTILASILYPCVRPDENNRIREGDFGAIRERFGQSVHNRVCATLALRAIEFKPLHKADPVPNDTRTPKQIQKDEEDRQKEHLKDFRTMALFATSKFLSEMPWAIAIRGVQYLTYVEDLRQQGEVDEEHLFAMNNIYAELLGVAGFWKMKEAVQNEYQRNQDPKLFAEIQKVIGQQTAAGHAKQKALLEQVRAEAVKVMDLTGIQRGFYEIEVYLKSPASVLKKMKEKGISIDQLHDHVKDFIQVGVTLDADAYHEAEKGALGHRRRHRARRYEQTEYELCRQTHAAWRSTFKQVKGPYKDPEDRQTIILKNGERRKAHEVDLVRDHALINWQSRFKDYMKIPNAIERQKRADKIFTPVFGPKANRYSAMHDVVTMPVGDSESEVELHITTKRRRLVNMYGIGAHGAYKTSVYKSEAAADQALVDWYTCVRGEDSHGHPVKNPPFWVCAYAANNRIVARHGPMNIGEFGYGINESIVADCVGAHTIEGGGPYGLEEGAFPFFPVKEKGIYPLETDIKSGMRVLLRADQGISQTVEQQDRVMKALRKRPADLRNMRRYFEALGNA